MEHSFLNCTDGVDTCSYCPAKRVTEASYLLKGERAYRLPGNYQTSCLPSCPKYIEDILTQVSDQDRATSVNELHQESMDLAAGALIARMNGDATKATEIFKVSLNLEVAAINALTRPVEPTYSVMHRSAATLAIDCKEYRIAEKLASRALAEEPPPEIAEELRAVLLRALAELPQSRHFFERTETQEGIGE